MMNVLQEVDLDIYGKEYAINCEDWDAVKYSLFFASLAHMQLHDENALFKVALYLDYVDNDIWDALDIEHKNKILLKKNCTCIKNFVDEVLGLKDGTVPDYIVDYFDYDEVWNDMQDGEGEFENWSVYPVMTDWGFIALIPR